MESVVLEDSPLAQYLEGTPLAEFQESLQALLLTSPKAEGTRDPDQTSELDAEAISNDSHQSQPSFAPRGTASIRARLKDKLPAKLQLQIPSRTAIGKIHDAWSVS